MWRGGFPQNFWLKDIEACVYVYSDSRRSSFHQSRGRFLRKTPVVQETTERLRTKIYMCSGKLKNHLKASDGAKVGNAVIHVRIITVENWAKLPSHGATDSRVKD